MTHDVGNPEHEIIEAKHELVDVIGELGDVGNEVAKRTCEVIVLACAITYVKRASANTVRGVADAKDEGVEGKCGIAKASAEVADVVVVISNASDPGTKKAHPCGLVFPEIEKVEKRYADFVNGTTGDCAAA